MGQINCECREQTFVDSMQTIVPNFKTVKNRKVRNRVKSILSPRQPNLENRKSDNTNDKFKIKGLTKESSQQIPLGQSVDNNNLKVPFFNSKSLFQGNNNNFQYAVVKIVGNICQSRDIEVRGKITTVGTQQAQYRLKKFEEHQQDQYRMHLKYENGRLYVKDSGIGLGIFILKERFQLNKIINRQQKLLLINWDKNFITFQQNQEQQISWVLRKHQEPAQKGFFQLTDFDNINHHLIIKDIVIYTDKLTRKKFVRHLQKSKKLFIQCQQFEELRERDILRCGLTLYRVDNIQAYIDSSRLVHRY